MKVSVWVSLFVEVSVGVSVEVSWSCSWIKTDPDTTCALLLPAYMQRCLTAMDFTFTSCN